MFVNPHDRTSNPFALKASSVPVVNPSAEANHCFPNAAAMGDRQVFDVQINAIRQQLRAAVASSDLPLIATVFSRYFLLV